MLGKVKWAARLEHWRWNYSWAIRNTGDWRNRPEIQRPETEQPTNIPGPVILVNWPMCNDAEIWFEALTGHRKTGLNWKRDKRHNDSLWINNVMHQSLSHDIDYISIIQGVGEILYKFEIHLRPDQSPLWGSCVKIQVGAEAPVNYYHCYSYSQFYWKLMLRELGYCLEYRDAENMSQQFIQ